MFAVYLLKDLFEGVLGFVCVVVVQLVHIEGKVGEHSLVKLVE